MASSGRAASSSPAGADADRAGTSIAPLLPAPPPPSRVHEARPPDAAPARPRLGLLGALVEPRHAAARDPSPPPASPHRLAVEAAHLAPHPFSAHRPVQGGPSGETAPPRPPVHPADLPRFGAPMPSGRAHAHHHEGLAVHYLGSPGLGSPNRVPVLVPGADTKREGENRSRSCRQSRCRGRLGNPTQARRRGPHEARLRVRTSGAASGSLARADAENASP